MQVNLQQTNISRKFVLEKDPFDLAKALFDKSIVEMKDDPYCTRVFILNNVSCYCLLNPRL
jgi:hypothetical protein